MHCREKSSINYAAVRLSVDFNIEFNTETAVSRDLLGLQDLSRPESRAGESSFPFERRFGRLQLDDQNLYTTTFSLRFADSGTTHQFWPLTSGS